MAFYIKARLSNVPVTYYKNFSNNFEGLRAENIVFCNTSASVAKVTLSFTLSDGDILKGFLVYEFPIAANSYLELKGRLINQNASIIAYSNVDDVVVFSCDVLGDNGEYISTLL